MVIAVVLLLCCFDLSLAHEWRDCRSNTREKPVDRPACLSENKNPAAAGFFIIDFSLRNKEMNRF
ncbi:hypothetical protein CGT96_04680 [Vibrio metoecus]|nr:hypothetical protein CGT96_04680 [Vibrio metoecus]